MNISKLAILGPGLLGGSIGLAMRERSPRTRLAVWSRREEAAEHLRQLRIAEISSTHLAPVVEDADVVVLCVPIGAMRELSEKIAPLLPPRALVTDVGSAKKIVVETLAPIFENRARFIGSHPMAGSERTGIEAASADLFQNAVCIVTPDEKTDASAAAEAKDFWRLLGCTVREFSPQKHDEVVALVSHLPHLLAATLVNFVCARDADSLNCCGNGFRDTTRVASGAPEMWTEILRANRAPLQAAIDSMIENLNEVSTLLSRDDENALREFLTRAKSTRDRLRKK